MRWKSDTKEQPKVGDTRTREGFLLLPKHIGGETRWLEGARWKEEYRPSWTVLVGIESSPVKTYEWRPVKWLRKRRASYVQVRPTQRGNSVRPSQPTEPPKGPAPKPPRVAT